MHQFVNIPKVNFLSSCPHVSHGRNKQISLRKKEWILFQWSVHWKHMSAAYTNCGIKVLRWYVLAASFTHRPSRRIYPALFRVHQFFIIVGTWYRMMLATTAASRLLSLVMELAAKTMFLKPSWSPSYCLISFRTSSTGRHFQRVSEPESTNISFSSSLSGGKEFIETAYFVTKKIFIEKVEYASRTHEFLVVGHIEEYGAWDLIHERPVRNVVPVDTHADIR